MYEILHRIFADQKAGAIFTCFGVWHILYMCLIVAGIVTAVCLLRHRSDEIRQRAQTTAIHLAFGLYILDFFLMPFAYGAIDLEKLPFHMCTAMCVLSFISTHHTKLRKFKFQFAVLGLVSNLIYVIYPAGVGWYQIHPLSYRTVQTLLFHGLMSAYGVFTLVFRKEKLRWRDSLKELVVIVMMTLWAILGNTLYNGTAGEYDHFFNWFFVVRDPFYILPASIAPYIMPFVMIAVIYVADLLVYAVWKIPQRRTKR